MFAEFGVLNYLTYLVGAIFIIRFPARILFVLKTGIAHGVKKGIWRRQACLLAMRC